MANTTLPDTSDNQTIAGMEEQSIASGTARLNALIDKIKTGLRRINNLSASSGNPELAKLATNYTSLLTQANSLLDKVDNSGSVEMLAGELSRLEGQFEKCLHDARQEATMSGLAAQQATAIMLPDQYWNQYLGTLALMTNDLQVLRRQNRQVQTDLRLIHWGHRHFHHTIVMASILTDTGEPPELKSAKVEQILSTEQAQMEAEVNEEEHAMLAEGASAEEVAIHHARFRAFIGTRVRTMHMSAHAVAGKMQLGYDHARPVIANMYGHYVTQPMDAFRQHYPVYQQNVNAFMQKHTAATRHMSGDIWASGTARMQALAAQMGEQAGRLRDVINNARDLRVVISESEAIGMDQTLLALMQQNYVDGCSFAQNLKELKEQEQLVSDLLSGRNNDPESLKRAAGFLGMESNINVFVRQVNAYRNAHQIPEIKIKWSEMVRNTPQSPDLPLTGSPAP